MRIAIEKNAKILALFAIACTAVVGTVHLLTKDTILHQEQLQLLTKLNNIIAPERYNNDIYLDCIIITADSGSNKTDNGKNKDEAPLFSNLPQKAYIARMDDQPVAIAFTNTAPDGYNGKINMLVAVNLDSSVSGVRVLTHNETPGLGDKIEIRRSDWIKSFTDKSITDETDSRWAVSKDGGMFDQFTGATITPRAVVKTVKRTALYFAKYQKDLFVQTGTCQDNS
ncbi:MAG: electron transport complex subunit RsxG [Alteromonadaceae bacterium]|nr:electron transport complex subunit RsxG [Alteromonadaceae bacterium]